ncbi:MAG: AraC family transcriptional regulator [Pseudomonadota bacterium]
MLENRFFRKSLVVSPLGGLRIACDVSNGVGVLTHRRVLPHFTLVFVTEGTGTYWDEAGREYDIVPGDSILVCPGVEHWYGPAKGKTWNETFVVFEGPIFDLWREREAIDSAKPVRHLEPHDYWQTRIREAVGDDHGDDPHQMVQEVIRLQQLLADIEHVSREHAEADVVWLEKAQQAIVETGDPKRATRQMGISYESFRKRFKRLSGQPPGRYARRAVMEQACNLLHDNERSLREIAEELGFCDEYHFSKQFSKTIGWSPKEYRVRTAARDVSA